MHRLTAAALTASLLLALTACSSYSAEDCQKALTDASTKTSRPTECQDLSQEDYDVLLTNWALQKALNGMSKEDRDLLDYSDDGSINGSISGD
ncbi:hypothetical protein [Streptomyces zaomyceticus]|uniref:hypothetical protein n=1 Tax=Streptomyces zaomyceticus TaxID=68286 RepID=UPI002E0FE06F|nr:hypothetical protein OG237_06550 [Streptomyces zaomyceticus]